MARSAKATRRRAEKRNRTEQDQRKVDDRDLEKGVEREERERKKVRGEKDEAGAVSTDTDHNDVEVEDAKEREGLQHYEQILTGLLGGDNNNPETKEPNATMKKTAGREKPKVDDKNCNNIDPALKEPGSWICKGCNNHNYASKHVCHSKTCDEKRPAGSYVPPKYQRFQQFQRPATSRRDPAIRPTITRTPKSSGLPTLTSKKSRHDPATSKTMKWGEQASTVTLDKNQDLRKQYMETGGEGMEEADVARAKLLLERDERKKQKKELRKKGKKR